MKKLLLLIGLLTLYVALNQCFSQVNEGVITYEAKVNLHRRIPPGQEEMKKMMPEFRVSKEQLFFSSDESLYKPIIEDEVDELDNGGGVNIKIGKPYFEYYLNKAANEVVVQREFMGKNYLINKQLTIAPWKFSDETKTILGYSCKQAFYTAEDTKQTVTAWYTDQLRPFLGPNTYNTLPGAVLALDINNEEQVFVATNIEFKKLKKNDIKIPKGGEPTTDEEFKKMMDEKIKQMGGGHGMVIRN